MKALTVVSLALVLVGGGLAVLGSNPIAAAPVSVADSSACPPPAPTSSGFGPAPGGYHSQGGLQTVVPMGGYSPAIHANDYNTTAEANVTVSSGDLLVVAATAVNFGPGAGNGPDGSGAPVLKVSDSMSSFFWIGDLSDGVYLSGGPHPGWLYEAGPGNWASAENITYETWFATAGAGGIDRIAVTLENPAPDTSLGYPGFTTPDVLAFAFPAGDGALAGSWADYWDAPGGTIPTYLTANVTTGQCVSLLALGFAADGFPDTWAVGPLSPAYGEDTNYTPGPTYGGPTGYSRVIDGWEGAGGDLRFTYGPLSSAETFMGWEGWDTGSTATAFVSAAYPTQSPDEDGLELIATSPDLAAGGLGENGGCPTATFQWTNPTPPFGETLVNDTVYVYGSTGTLVQAISTNGPSTGATVTGLVCGQHYTFQVQPWYSSGLPGPLSSALSFIAGQVAGSFLSHTAGAMFLGLGWEDWAAIGAVAAAGTVVAVVLTRRGHRGGRRIGG